MKISLFILAFQLIAFQAMTFGQHSKPKSAVRIHLEGTIVEGQGFEKKINGRLVIKLVPEAFGWDIWVGSSRDSEINLCRIATPPFHGINALSVEGWHFRNNDNTGPNEPGEKNVPAPQRTRSFNFAVNQKDYDALDKIVEKILYPHQTSDEKKAVSEFDKFPKGRGVLHIKTLKLGNLMPGKQAWIKKMTFSIDLELPKMQRKSGGR